MSYEEGMAFRRKVYCALSFALWFKNNFPFQLDVMDTSNKSIRRFENWLFKNFTSDLSMYITTITCADRFGDDSIDGHYENSVRI